MNIDGFITMPSFRPDGRLDGLNHGGGSKLPKTIPGEPKRFQKAPDLFRLVALAAHAEKHGLKELDVKTGYVLPAGGAKPMQKPKGGSSSHAQQQQQASKGTGGAVNAGMYTQGNAPAASAAVAGPKKRRTLLSGGGRSFAQPYGSDTVLGG